MPESGPRWKSRHIVLVTLVAALTRFTLLYLRIRQYQQGAGIQVFGGSDVPGWLGMASHLSSRFFDLSYWLMGARPPLFPMTVALVYKLGGTDFHAVMLQTLFGVATVTIGYLTAYRLFTWSESVQNPEKWALFAGLIMACDPASISTSATLMGEPLFNLIFAGVILAVTLYVQHPRWRTVTAIVLLLAAAMFTRPTAIYFWLAVPLMIIPFVKNWRLSIAVITVASLCVYFGWSARNLKYTGVFTYSLQTNFSLLFLRGLSAEHLATDRPVDELYIEYTEELFRRADQQPPAEIDSLTWWRFLVAESPEIYQAMGELAREKLTQYPGYAILATPVGLWRLFATTNVYPLWFRPIELIYHAVLYSLVAAGVWLTFRKKDWKLLLIPGIPILYVTGLTITSQLSAMDTRMRTPMSTSLIILATVGAAVLTAHRQERKAKSTLAVSD